MVGAGCQGWQTWTSSLFVVVLLTLAAAVTACSSGQAASGAVGDGGPNTTTNGPDAANVGDATVGGASEGGAGPDAGASIGPDGGSITLGSGSSAATITVPPGALASPQVLTVTETTLPCPTGFTCYSPVFQFEPAGTTFQQPVTVSLPFQGNQQLATLFWSYPSATGYQRIGGLPSGDTVAGNVTHFSTGFIADGVNYSQPADPSCVQTLGIAGRYSGQTQIGGDAGLGCVSNCGDAGCQTGCPSTIYPMTASAPDGGQTSLGSAVALFFNVQDCEGRAVTSLDAGSFTVLEDNNPLSVEAQTTILPTNGVTVFADLVLDVSSHTDSMRTAMFMGAENFVTQLQVTDNLPVAIGIETFAGEQQITEQLAPTLNTQAIITELQSLGGFTDAGVTDGGFVDPDPNSTNFYGAVIESLANLDQVEAAFEQRNYGGAFAVGFSLFFTDGLDTSGYYTEQQALQAEQGDFSNQLVAIALQDSTDYVQGLPALTTLTYGGQTLINSPNPSVAEGREFPYLATYIAGDVSGAYLLGYCSPKRANANTVTVEVSNTNNLTTTNMGFNATSFGPGCSAQAFGTACAGWQCGGIGCGACDYLTSECTGPSSTTLHAAAGTAANQCEANVTVSVGTDSACALLGGTVECWGLGSGTTTSTSTPVAVSGLSGATAVSVGSDSACALLGGTVECWGLGSGTTTSSPVAVSGLSGATAVSVGSGSGEEMVAHSVDSGSGGATAYSGSACALLSSGTVECWGDNTYGELGNGTTTSSSTPVAVSGLSGATAVSVGSESACALLSGGTVECWGDNTYGELGDGTTTNSSTPVAVSGLSGVTAVSVGSEFGLCASFGRHRRVLGGRGRIQLLDPVAVSGPSGATAVSVGSGSACALLGGTVKCWVGVGGAEMSTTGLSGATAVSVGDDWTCAVSWGGTVECWPTSYDVSGTPVAVSTLGP